MTRMGFLREVCAVAGGALYAVGKIEALGDELEQYAAQIALPPVEAWPEFGFGLGHPAAEAMMYEFFGLLGWACTIDERLDRPCRPGSLERFGLLPELTERPLEQRATELAERFRDDVLERHLANYTAHAGSSRCRSPEFG